MAKGKRGYHVWPSDGKPHPVGKVHKGKKQNGWPIVREKYKAGRWEFIKLMVNTIKYMIR